MKNVDPKFHPLCLRFDFPSLRPWLSGLAGVIALSLGAERASASTINWGTVTTISDDTDVSTLGALDRAHLFGTGSTIVNGVTFSTFGGGDSTTLTGVYGGFGEGTPFGNLSAGYRTLLTNGYYSGTTATVTLNNINVGLNYEIQAWVNDSRACCSGRNETISGSGSLAYSTLPGASGGIGSYVKGLFTADATNQVLSLSAGASAQMNGLQLRATGVSPGNTATITSARNWNALTIGTGGTLKYNLSTSVQQSTVLSGAGSLEKAGATTLQLGAVQAYGGATNITGGTLRPAPVNGSTLWLDAAKTSSITTSGASVTQWNDAAGGTNFATQGTAAARPNLTTDNAFTGPAKAMVDFGVDGNSGKWMQFNNNLTDIRTAFWIMKGANFLLGSTGAYDFHRDGALAATSNIWSSAYASGNIQSGQTYLNGTLVNGTTTPLSTNYQMIDLVTTGNVQANALANDRNLGGRQGGQQIGEVIIFNTALNNTDRQLMETYLNYKWFGTGPGVGNILPVTTPVTISGGGTLDLSGVNFQTIASLTSSDPTSRVTLGAATLTVGDASNTAFAGVISESGALVKVGSGKLSLSNANTYSGLTTISAGTLELEGTAGSISGTTVINNGTLQINKPNAFSYAGTISGSGGLTQSGAGTTTLSGPNSFTGPTLVSGGALQLNGAAAGTLSTSGVVISNGANLGFTAGAASVLNLSGKSLTLSGSLLLDIGASGTNDSVSVTDFTLTGNSLIAFNTIGAIANGVSYTLLSSANPITTNGFTISGQTVGKLSLTPTVGTNSVTVTPLLLQGIWNQTGGGNWSVGNPSATGGNWTNYKPTAAGDAALFGSAITGAATITVDTAHTLAYMAFNNTNSYTIGTNGSGNLTLDNGAAPAQIGSTSGNHTIAENVLLSGGGGAIVDPSAGAIMTISGNVSGAGALQMGGSGTLLLTGSNSQAGGTVVSSGILKVGSTTALGSSGAAVVVTPGGSIDVNNQLLPQQPTISGSGLNATTGAIFNSGDAFNSGFAALTLAGNASIGNNGGRFDLGRTAGSTTQGNGFILTKVGNNLIGIQAPAVNLAGVVINGGTLQTENSAAYGTAPVTINNSGVLSAWGGLTMTNALTINTGGTLRQDQAFNDVYSGPVTLGGAATVDAVNGIITLSGTVSGGGSLTKTGANTLILSGTNAHLSTIVNAGTLKAASDSALGAAGASVSVASGASLDINGRTLQGYTQNVLIAGAGASPTLGALGNSGGGNLSAIRGVTLTGNASIGGDGGRWDIGRLDFNGDPNITVNHIDGGGFVLTKVGANSIGLLSGATNLAGFIMNGGMIQPHENTSFGSGPVTLNSGIIQPWGGLTLTNALTINGGTVQTEGFNDVYNGVVSVNAAATINAPGGSVTFNGAVSGTGDLSKVGTGLFVLAGNNTQTGTLTVAGGNVRFASLAGNATKGNVVMTGSGSFLLMTAPNQFGPNSGLHFNAPSYAEMALYGNNQTIASLSSANAFAVVQNSHSGIGVATASSTLTVNQNTDTTYSGYIRDNTSTDAFTLALTKSGSGKLTLLGANITYTGPTTINDGTLALGAGGVLADATPVSLTSATSRLDISGITGTEKIASLTTASGSIVQLGANTLEFGNGGDTILSGLIEGAGGSINKAGSGIVTMARMTTNTYSGSTNLLGGTLLLGASNVLPDSAAFTLSGGTKFATGGFLDSTGPLTLGGAATIDFGAGSASMLTFSDVGTWNGVLSVWNYTGGAVWTPSLGDKLNFTLNTNNRDLSSVQFYSDNGVTRIGLGAGFIGSELVPVPEPGSITIGGVLFGWVLCRERRRRTGATES